MQILAKQSLTYFFNKIKSMLDKKISKEDIDLSYLKLSNNKLTLDYEKLLISLKEEFISQVDGTTKSLWIGTQEEYNNISSKNPQTTYIIKGE